MGNVEFLIQTKLIVTSDGNDGGIADRWGIIGSMENRKIVGLDHQDVKTAAKLEINP
jgi:hypothetical protein